MELTNNAGLPAPLVSALTVDNYDYANTGDLSVTSAIMPPKIRQLLKRHKDEITEDVSERIWRVVGDIAAGILERAGDNNVFKEERLSMRLHGWTITGKVDLMFNAKDDTYAIDDYKFVSVWSVKDAKPEWEAQLNLYALLARANSFNIKQLRIIAILRDWSKPRAAREPDYPQAGVVVRKVPLWSEEKAASYLSERVLAHQAAEKLADDDIPLCTDEERWKRPDSYAVKKKGNKRALRLFDTHAEAEAMSTSLGGNGAYYEIELRPGAYVRCEQYCPVRSWCVFGRLLEVSHAENGQDN
jgi:hypothetical protein